MMIGLTSDIYYILIVIGHTHLISILHFTSYCKVFIVLRGLENLNSATFPKTEFSYKFLIQSTQTADLCEKEKCYIIFHIYLYGNIFSCLCCCCRDKGYTPANTHG